MIVGSLKKIRTRLDLLIEHPPVRGEKMSKRLGGIKGCKYMTSSWHLNVVVRASVFVSLNAFKPFGHPPDRQAEKSLAPKLFKEKWKSFVDFHAA